MRADPDMLKDGPFRTMWVFIVTDVRTAADTLKTADGDALSPDVQEQGITSGSELTLRRLSLRRMRSGSRALSR